MDRYQLIWKCIQRRGYEFDYRKVPPTASYLDYIWIGCDKHEFFNQKVQDHLCYGRGCTKCQYEHLREIYAKSKEKFVEDAIKVHDDRYCF